MLIVAFTVFTDKVNQRELGLKLYDHGVEIKREKLFPKGAKLDKERGIFMDCEVPHSRMEDLLNDLDDLDFDVILSL